MKVRRFGSVMAMFGLGILGILSAQAQDATRIDKSLVGTWVGESKDKKLTMVFEANGFSVKFDDEEVNGTIKVNPAAKPRTMDLTVTGGRGPIADGFAGKTSLAIYEIDGDTLKWCVNEPGKDARPDAFPDNVGDDRHLYVIFKRERKSP